MNKVYLVLVYNKGYGDWCSIAAFESLEDAKSFKAEKESQGLVYDEHYDELLDRITRYAQYVADRKGLNPRHDDYWRVVDSIEEPLNAKVKKKYPRFTNSPWEESSIYTIESVPFYGSFNFNLERMQNAVESGTVPVEEVRKSKENINV